MDKNQKIFSKKSNTGNAGGYVLLTAIIFFLISSSLIVLAVAETVAGDLKIASDLARSKESFFTADGSNEDVIYRLKNNLSVSPTETLKIGNQTANTTITDVVGGKTVQSSGDSSSRIRKITAKLSQGSGAGFFYGVQAGEGGVSLYNTSSIVGNVFSNGPVVSDSSVSTGNATNPDLVGSITVGGHLKTAVDLAVSGAYAYVLTLGTFDVVNVANPANPLIVKTVTSRDHSISDHTSIEVSGNYLYITTLNHDFLDIYDITNPGNPSFLSHAPLPYNAQPLDVTVSAGYAYVVNNVSNNMTVINVSNPAQPIVTATISTQIRPRGITISGSYLYLVYNDYNFGGVQVFSLANPGNPTALGDMGNGPSALYSHFFPAYKAGHYFYILSLGLRGFYVVDVSNPSNPTKIYTSPQFAIHDVAWVDGSGGYLYIAEDDIYNPENKYQSLEVWGLSNPQLPAKISSTAVAISAGHPKALVVKNGHVYLLNYVHNGTSKFQIYNISGGSGGNTVYGDVISAGPNGSVSKIHATSSIYARTISNSIADKDVYYQSISNSSVGGNSYPGSADQTTSTMPISDAVIAGWETDAVAGGTINTPCPYQINTNVTIGPKKINCDLEISNDAVVTLTGPVWVSGNVIIKSTAVVKVSPTLSGRTLQIIADNPSNRTTSSKIMLENSSQYLGSGNNSYVMLISMNNSSQGGGSEVAIDVKNSATGSLIVYAPHGEISLQNSINLKEVTAYKLTLRNSAKVIYESGLSNLFFTSGPSGGYTFGGWGEQ